MPEHQSTSRVHYRALDGLRFIAFLLVYIHHTFYFRQFRPLGLHLESFSLYQAIGKMGWAGVDLFFAISGFLITDLLLREQNTFGEISLRKFWMRRILRIWPLYFFSIAIAFLILSHISDFNFVEPKFGSPAFSTDVSVFLPWFLFFLGNWTVVFLTWPTSGVMGILWSVCVEEQFYLIWPPLLKFLNPKRVLFSLFFLLFLSITLRAIIIFLNPKNIQNVIHYNTFTHFEPIALGCLVAFIRSKFEIYWMKLASLHYLWLFVGILGFIITFSVGSDPLKENWHAVWQYALVGFSCAALVLSAVSNDQSFVNRLLSSSILIWLGKISFGLYVYHLWGIRFANLLLDPFFLDYNFQSGVYSSTLLIDVLWWLLSLFLTILISSLSYYCFERHFLKLKTRYSKIASRPV